MLNFFLIFFINSIFWIIVFLISGYIVHLFKLNFFNLKNPIFKIRKFEKNLTFYKKILKINKWKDKFPEKGNFYKINNFSKKKLKSKKLDYLERYIIETCKGELAHILPFFFYPISNLWNPFPANLIMFLFCFLFNIPFIFILRYNRIRIYNLINKYYKKL